MADYVSPEARRRIATGLMAAQYDRATPEEGNVVQRHGLLPLGTYDNGKTGLAFPGFVAEPLESWGRLLRNGYTSGDTQGVEDAFNVAGAAMMGGLAAPKPRNVVGSAGGELKGAALGAIPDTPGIRAYHGSPYDFDEFDMSKIGTGEGAQAYGHGLYFAEREGVAKSYRERLSNDVQTIENQHDPNRIAGKFMTANGGRKELAALEIESLIDEITRMPAMSSQVPSIREYAQQQLAGHEAALDLVKSGTAKQNGHMYEVNIKANPDDFLDWDKPLSQQPKVAGLVGTDEQGRLMLPNGERAPPDKLRGESFYRAFAEAHGGGTHPGSQALREAGIPGIRYLDQGSRAGGEGSRNLVVFDDKLIEILRKYGLLGMAGGAAAAEYGSPQNPMLPPRPASPQYRPGDA